MLGAMVVAFAGVVLGGLGGGIVSTLIGRMLERPRIRILGVIAGAMLGMAIQPWTENAEGAWSGFWQGSIVGALAGPILFFALGLALDRFEKKRA